jgi:hypothetical protein
LADVIASLDGAGEILKSVGQVGKTCLYAKGNDPEVFGVAALGRLLVLRES